MFVGTLGVDLLLGDVHSLKEKRRRPPDRRRAAAHVRGQRRRDRRTWTCTGGPSSAVAVVAPDAGHCREVLDACERLVAGRPEVELLSAGSGSGRRDE